MISTIIYILLSRILHQGDSQCVGPQQCSSPCHPVFPRRAAVQCGCTTLLCAAAHPESQRGLRWEIPYEIPQRVTGNWSWASSFQQGFSECEKTWNHQAGICENICSPKYTLASCFCCDVDWFTEISHPSGDHPGIHLQNPQNSWNRNPKKKDMLKNHRKVSTATALTETFLFLFFFSGPKCQTHIVHVSTWGHLHLGASAPRAAKMCTKNVPKYGWFNMVNTC